ncbi:MAG: hypothetical protein KA385_16045 [Vicinamibacteria bacterium]|nr:hypothetical protein [Vicinamibacteria bacterium]
MHELPEASKHRWDHPVVGMFASIAVTIILAALGSFLLLKGDSTGRRHLVPEFLRLPGLLLLLFSGVAGAAIAAVFRASVARRGWPRAAKGALWTSVIVGALNLAIVALVFALRFRQLSIPQP